MIRKTSLFEFSTLSTSSTTLHTTFHACKVETASDIMAPDPPPTAKQPNADQAEATEYNGVAANAVFITAELLEKILINVSLKTLFTSQRVNKQ